MSVRSAVLHAERSLLGLRPTRWIVRAVEIVGARVLWLWGRIRFGALVRNRGLGCVCHWAAELKYPENITLGDGVVIGERASIGARSPVRLGDRVRISREVIIETAGLDFSTGTPPFQHVSRPIVIEAGVWIGARAIILGGVSIGQNAVVAAGAVVTRSIPAGCIAAGVPARPLAGPAAHDKEFSHADG